MENKKIAYIIANFGGPRDLTEIYPFLKSLLTDQDVIRTKLPRSIHHFLFSLIAKRRAKKMSDNYKEMGGKSPIFDDTEAVGEYLREHFGVPVLTFHRYLPATHSDFLHSIAKLKSCEIHAFPMFPQFTYATTGSIARWFEENLPPTIVHKIRWVKSYPTHPAFILAHQRSIRDFLARHQLEEEKTILLFSAHGLPKKFIKAGEVYEEECEASFRYVTEALPKTLNKLCYQSKFGLGAWLKPYTVEMCKKILSWNRDRKNVVFIPITFTSDHFETLFEIENKYMPIIREKKLIPYRIPALNLNPDWTAGICSILKDANFVKNRELYRNKLKNWDFG